MDLVIGVDDEAVNILLKHSEKLFPGIPILLVTAEQKALERDSLKPNMTSLVWGIDIRGTLELIQKVLPQTRHLFFISGSALNDKAVNKMAREALTGYAGPLNINYLTEMTKANLLKSVTQLPEHSAVIYLFFSRDAKGKSFDSSEIMSAISEKANVPLFGILETYLGNGIVGGSLLSAEEQGKKCAEIALQILKGKSPSDILPARVRNLPMFDWRKLKPWGIREDSLPASSIVRYKPPKIWETHKRAIIGVTLLIMVQVLLIFFLLVQRVRKRRTEQNLAQAESDYRTIADFTYDWEYWADLDGTLRYVSPSCKRISGYNPLDFIEYPSLLREIILPEDRDIWDRHYRDARNEPGEREIQFRIHTKSGEIRWIEHVCQPVKDPQGTLLGVRASNRDITDRKQDELNLRDALYEIKQLKNQLEADTAYLSEEIKLEHNYEHIIGKSDALQYVLFKVEQVSATDTTVLVLGETGTGKELIARAIHNTSARKNRPLVKLNCATLPANLIESELFGHEKGAFTGAQTRQMGRFEAANGTSIFLDEIGELPLELQSKLLRVLQDGEFERLGSSATVKVDVRVIAATNRNLEGELNRGRFRQDLWYRLNVFPITAPPLRDRMEDIPILVNYFVDRFARIQGKTITTIPKGAMTTLQNYPWPGNVRELENVIERAVINTSGPKLLLVDKLEKIHMDLPTSSKTLEEMERDYIFQVLVETKWRIEGPKGAALILGINPSTLRSRMRKLNIQKP
jgi:PAS domain S-box-containing protein